MRSKKELLSIAHCWVDSQIDSWVQEYEAWDMVVEDEGLTEDELEWIQENVKFTIKCEEM